MDSSPRRRIVQLIAVRSTLYAAIRLPVSSHAYTHTHYMKGGDNFLCTLHNKNARKRLDF